MKIHVDVFVAEGWQITFESRSPRLALLGPNGSGKSTVLRALAGDPGVVAKVVLDDLGQDDVPPNRRRVGYATQRARALPGLRVREELELAGQESSQLLQRFGLTALATRSSASLSGGELARLGVARALSHRPKLVLLDEPFAAIDVRRRGSLRAALIEELDALGASLVIATHSIADVMTLSADVLVLDQEAEPVFIAHEALSTTDNAFVRAMLQSG